jgi:hypothetical protein
MSTYAGIVYLEQSNPSDHQHFISYTRDYHQQLKMYIPGDSIRYRIRYRTDRNPIESSHNPMKSDDPIGILETILQTDL